jgi:cytoskeletal protein RodZ
MPYREVVVEREAPVRDNSSALIIGVLVVLTVALLLWLFLLRGNAGRVTENIAPQNVPADSTSESRPQNAPAQSNQTEPDQTRGSGSGAASVQTDSGSAEVEVNDTVTQSSPQ